MTLDVNRAIDRIPDGSCVVAAPACGTPTTLVRALAARAGDRGLSLWTGLLFDPEPVIDAVARGALRYVTWHVSRGLRPLLAAGQIDDVPIRASQVPAHLTTWGTDVALIRVTPPDRNGWCSLGPSVSYVRAALECASLRIAEVDVALPRTWGQSMVHVSELDVLVESTEPQSVYEPAEADDVSRSIARHLVDLLPDRPLLQVGIGAVPEALVYSLAELGVGDLRFAGMGSDGMVELAERGLLDRACGGMSAIAAPDLLGTSRLMRFAHDNPTVGVYPSTIAHSPIALAATDRLVSVNSAVEVDLTGQVNAERARGQQISGVGGSIDFFEGATHSRDGLRVVALPSTTADGATSRIVPRVGPDATVTVPKALVDVVVTEHGVARLAGRSTRERLEALLAIAAPGHRDALLEEVR